MKCVYLLESERYPGRHYTGFTADLDKRLAEHNAGKASHTSKYRPWRVVVALHFADAVKAADFERYLKSGSGQAFANRHFR